METLYRHFDSNSVLLYIGISCNHEARLKAHKKTSRWYPDVSRIEIEQYETRDEVLAAEKKAIQSESPLHNITYNKSDCLYESEIEDVYAAEDATFIMSGVRNWAISTRDLSFDNFVASMG